MDSLGKTALIDLVIKHPDFRGRLSLVALRAMTRDEVVEVVESLYDPCPICLDTIIPGTLVIPCTVCLKSICYECSVNPARLAMERYTLCPSCGVGHNVGTERAFSMRSIPVAWPHHRIVVRPFYAWNKWKNYIKIGAVIAMLYYVMRVANDWNMFDVAQTNIQKEGIAIFHNLSQYPSAPNNLVLHWEPIIEWAKTEPIPARFATCAPWHSIILVRDYYSVHVACSQLVPGHMLSVRGVKTFHHSSSIVAYRRALTWIFSHALRDMPWYATARVAHLLWNLK